MYLYEGKNLETSRLAHRQEKNTSFIFQNTPQLRFKTSVILFVNVLFLVLMLILQIILGIGPGLAHVDEVTYLTYSSNSCSNQLTVSQIIGRSYYCFVKVLNFEIAFILTIQCGLYLLTSFIIYSRLKDMCTTSYSYFLLILLVFDPYRAHLALHVLKETFIILGVILLQKNVIVGFLLTTAFRFYSFIYLLIFLRARAMVFVIFFFTAIIMIFQPSIISHILMSGNADMQFRDFDLVPTFNDFGLAGDLLRAMVWPIFLISGTFLFISPSILFLPVALGGLFTLLFLLKMKPPISVFLGPFMVLALLALIAPGFTTFTRYAYPVVIALPLLVLGVTRSSRHAHRGS